MDHIHDAYKIIPTDGNLVATCWICGMDFIFVPKVLKQVKEPKNLAELVCSL